MSTIKTFGDVDARSLEQLERCMAAGDAEFGVLCADHHPGYSQPIGGGIAYEGYVSPSGVGYDIGCGNKAVRPSCAATSTPSAASSGDGEITRRISFGMGVPATANRPPGAREIRTPTCAAAQARQLAESSSAPSARATTT